MRLQELNEELVQFVCENFDESLCERVNRALVSACTEGGAGHTKPSLVAIAHAVAAFLKMCQTLMQQQGDAIDMTELLEDFYNVCMVIIAAGEDREMSNEHRLDCN